MVVGIGKLKLLRVELRHVGCEYVTAACLIRFDSLVRGAECDDLVFHSVGAKEVREIEFGRGARLSAHRRTVEFERRVDLERFPHHEALAVVIGHADEVAVRNITRQSPRCVARQHVDLAGLEWFESVLSRERHELDLDRVIQDRRRKGATEVDIEAGPIALSSGLENPGNPWLTPQASTPRSFTVLSVWAEVAPAQKLSPTIAPRRKITR